MKFPDESTWVCQQHVVFGHSLVSLWEHVERKHLMDKEDLFRQALQPLALQQQGLNPQYQSPLGGVMAGIISKYFSGTCG